MASAGLAIRSVDADRLVALEGPGQARNLGTPSTETTSGLWTSFSRGDDVAHAQADQLARADPRLRQPDLHSTSELRSVWLICWMLSGVAWRRP